jgi:hypothetical protein
MLAFVGAVFAMGGVVGCTRKASDQQSLKITFNPHGSGQGAQTTITGALEFAVINIQLPTGLIVKQFEFHDNPKPAGETLTIEVPDVPKGTFLVQFLGVFEANGQPSIIAYDDAYAVVDGVSSEVTLTAEPKGTFTREGRVVGRYINTLGPPETGPTGTLIMQYQPPDQVPKMSIERSSIVDGWFNIMAFDGVAMDYVMQGSNDVIFSQVKMESGALYMNGGVVPTGNDLAKFSMPATYRLQSGDGGGTFAEGRPPTDIFVGFIAKSGVSMSPKKVCYPNNITEGTPYYLDAALANRMDIVTTGVVSSAIHIAAGGVGDVQTMLYTGASTPCTGAAADKIVAYHTMLTPEGDRSAGIQPPFQAIKPFRRWDNFIRSEFKAAPARISLSWQYLPGVVSISGAAVMAKYSANFGGGHSESCEELLKDGYVEVASVGVGTTNFDFTGTPGQPVTLVNKGNFNFALCPYKNQSGGPRQWLGELVTGGQLNSGEDSHVGWANAAANSAPGTFETYTGLGGASESVSSVVSSNPLYTLVNLYGSPTPPIFAGDEILAMIVGRGNSGACGTYNGEISDVGRFTFARVVGGSSNTLKISKDTFLDSLDSLGTELAAAAAPASSYCRIVVYKVLHYRNLNLSGTTTLSAVAPYDFVGGLGGGVLPIRVNNQLTLGATQIHANAGGYAGGTMSAINGAGIRGPSGAASTSSGGQSVSSDGGGGGGGHGSGASAAVSGASGGSGMSMMNQYRMIMGGGGGLGAISTGSGGNGGGVVFIAAKSVSLVSGAPSIYANGGSGFSTGGGGGGGGSIVFLARSLTRSASETFTLSASGGSGNSNGGAGGGGSATAWVCSTNMSGANYAAIANVGGGVGVGASGGTANFQVGGDAGMCSNE